MTDTAELADRRVTSLSGGERQRVLVARVVAQDAPVVLLDEPTASLDLRHQLRTLRLARDLADAGRTVVAAIHDLDLAARFCDEVAVLADGDCVTTGPPAAVLSPDTVERAFDVSATVRTDPVTGSPLVTATPAREDPAGEVHVVGDGAAAASLCYPLRAAGFEVSVGPVPPGDRAVEVVGALDGDVITAPAFRSLDEETLAALEARIERADATVVAAGGVDPGRRPALQAASEADRLVVVADRDSGRRDPADEEGRRCLRRLRRRGRVVDADAVPDAVAALVEGAPAVAPDD